MGFFDDSGFGKQAAGRSPMCGKCGLLHKCRNAKLGVTGSGKKQILVVFDGPTNEDDRAGDWVAVAKPLEKRFAEVGINLERDCWMTGAVICSPNAKGYPSTDQVRHCRPNLLQVMDELNPVVIITVGSAATQAVLGDDWGEGKDCRISTWIGECIPSQKRNAWIIPCLNPAEVDGEKDMILMHIRQALKWAVQGLSARPWTDAPDYESMVDVYMEEAKAVEAIERMAADPRTEALAIDYETNALKPETTGASIYSISWSNGYETMAAPWFPAVREASRKLMISKIPKIACNLAFEERWTIEEFGHGVRAWLWDNMQAAHWMNNRPGITSIKFQSYAKLGQPDYASSITPYFKSKPNCLNRIQEVNMQSLLVYNGADTLLEYLVALDQIEESKYPHKFNENFRSLRPRNLRY